MRLLSIVVSALATLAGLIWIVDGLQYDPAYVQWNLNQAVDATSVLDYAGTWENHQYHPSPSNWRMPFYTIMLDHFVNGDPTNDNANGTVYEQDLWNTQLRHGGDIAGLKDSLDYIQGMGIKVLPMRCDLILGYLFGRYSISQCAMGCRWILRTIAFVRRN
jgi:alpha-1,3-glucan synthase